jgi:hypothetical protein
MDRAAAGNVVTRRWEISELEGELDALAGKSSPMNF